MARMTGGEALAKSLYREGARVVFGLPGVQLYGALAALRDEPGIRFVTTRHEQATTYMADGYARAGGGVGTALVVPGPGLFNAAAGLATAYAASSPVLLIVGQVPKGHIGKKVGVLHEVDEQLDAIRSITKWRRAVLEVADVPRAIHDAVTQLRTGRPRPVAIEIPPDTLEQEDEVELVPPSQAVRPAADPADVDRAAGILLAAGRPVMYAGGGVHASGAHEALRAVAEHLQGGVIESAEGKGAVSDANDLSLGAALWRESPVRRYLDGADVVLAVGTRLAVAALVPDQQVIQIDIDPDEVGRNHKKTLGLVGDARATLEALLAALRARSAPRPSRKAERDALRARVAAVARELEPPASILRSLRAGVPEDAIVVAGMTQVGYHTRPFWPVYHPRTYLTSSYSGNLGYAFPTALGAKVACPHRAVVSLSGDGGFLYNAQELATAVQYGINVVAVVFNDQAYGNVARDLDEAWGGKFAAELDNPDFMKLAEAYGVAGLRAKAPTDVGDLVREAVQMDRPVLIEVPVGRMPRPPFFGPRRVPARYQR
ncbi:MAG: thiamine pyrophosphate-binding protein [Candidatus Rokubacteria bacterium]|nr:thiamine pyrophosphate-binding protein [Candidatus Rokubacteria bacterium]